MRTRNKELMQRFNVSMTADLLSELDIATAEDFTSRSEFIRRAVRQRIDAERHIVDAYLNPQSYFNMIKKFYFRISLKRDWSKVKYKDIDWNG